MQLSQAQEVALYRAWELCFYRFSRIIVPLGFVATHHLRCLKNCRSSLEEVRRNFYLDRVSQPVFVDEVASYYQSLKERMGLLSRVWREVYNEEALFPYFLDGAKSPLVWSQPDFVPSVSPEVVALVREGRMPRRSLDVLVRYCICQRDVREYLIMLPFQPSVMEELCYRVHDRLLEYFDLEAQAVRVNAYNEGYPDLGFSNQLEVLRSSIQNARAVVQVFPGDMPLFRDGIFSIIRRVDTCRKYLFNGSRNLAISVARRYAAKVKAAAVSEDDLVQEGYIGLIKAIYKFEYRRGNRFSSYALWGVKHAIKDHLSSFMGVSRLPIHQAKLWYAIRMFKREFLLQHRREATHQEIAARFGVKVKDVVELHAASVSPQSLDAPVGSQEDGDSAALGDFIADPSAVSPVEAVERTDLMRFASMVIDACRPDEREILMRFFGLGGYAVETLGEIAERMPDGRKVSREAVRQRKENIIKKAMARFSAEDRVILLELLRGGSL